MVMSTRDAIASPAPPTPLELQLIAAGDDVSCRTLIERWESPIRIIAAYVARQSDLLDLT